jgi:hypothetical protein
VKQLVVLRTLSSLMLMIEKRQNYIFQVKQLVLLRTSSSSEQQALMLMMTMIQHLKTSLSKEKQYRMLRIGDGMVSVIESRQVWRTIQQR